MVTRWLFLLGALLLGIGFGVANYWPDLKRLNQPVDTNLQVKSVSSPSSEVDPKVLKQTPDLDRLLALNIPRPGASPEIWRAFFEELQLIPSGRFRGFSATHPLMALFAYTAKHQPELFYAKMSQSTGIKSMVSVLISRGLLLDWYQQVEQPQRWLLASPEAVKGLARKLGISQAKRLTAEAFLTVKEPQLTVNLYILRFAADAMNPTELAQVIDRLLRGEFKYDPRQVKGLIDLPAIGKTELVQLIKRAAYPSRSMSSYMATALRLGDTEYVNTLALDVEYNAKQPNNFYCSGCALALYTDGLIGRDLAAAARAGQVAAQLDSGATESSPVRRRAEQSQ